MSIQSKYEDITLSAIRTITNKKIADKIHPNYTLKAELKTLIAKGIEKTLDNLVKEGKIKKGDTMNDFYFEIDG